LYRAGLPSCAGSGVPGDIFEFGHSVVPGTEVGIFGPNPRFGNTYFRNRCYRCASTRYYWLRGNCKQKGSVAFRKHRKEMVKKGFAASEAEAEQIMRSSGVTPEFIAEMFRAAFGKPCPGLCGWPERHIITAYEDLQFDWRDPRYPLSKENCGPLCATCNQQKNNKPWPEFMHRQHAIRMNLEHATPHPPPPRQESLFDMACLCATVKR
jgi:hypothetical protein